MTTHKTLITALGVIAASFLSGPAQAMDPAELYKERTCIACHGAGIGGAPKVGDAGVWGGRIAQGPDVLNKHALEGYQGAAGYMPPKGGRIDLSDAEIIAAVEFMVDESR